MTIPPESLAARHWTREQQEAAPSALARIAALPGVVRLSFVDAHGVLRGKTLVAEEALHALHHGARATATLLMKDLSGKTAFPVYASNGNFDLPALRGAADMVMLPDPTTFHVLPWAPHTAWLLCDLYLPDGTPMPLSTRHILAQQIERLAARNLHFRAGVEIEFHVVRQPAQTMLNPGYQYLTELRYDELDPLMESLRATLQSLDLPLRTLEVEFGPSQLELTFAPSEGATSADQLILIRSAIKQTCRRQGLTASFMSRPNLPNAVSSGWHLHQSLQDPAGLPLMADASGLTPLARHYLGGLLAHASAACAFTTPTINGYRRYRPHTNAPIAACWAEDNRGAMIRVLRGSPAATRLENRVAEPAANPYLAMAAQIASGLDGIDRALDPGPPCTAPYEPGPPPLPRNLQAALAALREDACLNQAFGPFFIDYFTRLKQAELDRFDAEVTEWEHNEYFELL